jgi:DNA (cytosine-5)-methyltransferase 1
MIEWWQNNSGGYSCTLKIRQGCEGGGKGPLVQEEKSATLATHQDQTLFSFSDDGQEVARALTARMDGSPMIDRGPSIITTVGFMAGQGAKAYGTGASIEVAPTLKACPSGLNQSPTVALAGNFIDRETKQNGSGTKADGKSFTLNTVDRQGVAYEVKK